MRLQSLALELGVCAAIVITVALLLLARGTPEIAVKGNLDAAIAAQNNGDVYAARINYDRILATDPTNKFAYFDLGLIEQNAGRLNAAEGDYRQSLVIDPNFPSPLFNLAIVRTAQHDLGEAEALYRRLIAIAPDYGAAHNNLGHVLIDLGRVGEGNNEIERARQLGN